MDHLEAPEGDLKQMQKNACRFNMFITAIVAMLSSLATGVTMSYTTVAVVEYRSSNDTGLYEPLTKEQATWFVSIMNIAVTLGTFSCGPIADRIGFKITLICGCAMQLLFWMSVRFVMYFELLMLVRIISGIGCGLCGPSTYIYISDISLVKYRGLLSTLNSSAINLAYLYGFITGALIPFKYILLSSSLPLLLFFSFCWKVLYETPSWNVQHNHYEKADQSLRFLRGPHYDPSLELQEIKLAIEQQKSVTFKDKMWLMTSRQVYIPFGILLFLFACQSASGADTITVYSIDIITQTGIDINPYIMTVMNQVCFTVGYFSSSGLMLYMKRRTQFMLSGSVMIVAYTCLGFSLNVKDSVVPGSGLEAFMKVLPALCISISALAYGIGYGPVLYSMVGEIFPTTVKGICCSCILALKNCIAFALLKTFPMISSSYGLSVLFWSHAVVVGCGIVFALIFIPETQGKTMTEIHVMFEKKPKPPSESKSGPISKEEEAARA